MSFAFYRLTPQRLVVECNQYRFSLALEPTEAIDAFGCLSELRLRGRSPRFGPTRGGQHLLLSLWREGLIVPRSCSDEPVHSSMGPVGLDVQVLSSGSPLDRHVFLACAKHNGQTHWGRGHSVEGAVNSATGEALERHAALWCCYDNARCLTGIEVGADERFIRSFVDPRRDTWRSDFDIDWLTGFEVGSGNHCPIPAELVGFPYQSRTGGRCFYRHSTSGLAAGADFESAALAALLECIERASVDRSTSSQLEPIDWRAFHCEEIGGLVAACRETGLGIRMFWCHSSTSLPVAVVQLACRKVGEATGSASHWHAGTCLSRAISEAVQVWMAMHWTQRTGQVDVLGSFGQRSFEARKYCALHDSPLVQQVRAVCTSSHPVVRALLDAHYPVVLVPIACYESIWVVRAVVGWNAAVRD